MLSAIFMLLFACMFHGIVGRTRSVLSGRRGAPLLRPLRNVALLFRKGEAISVSTSAIFRIAPAASFAAAFTAMLMLPFAGFDAAISFGGDFVLFAGLMALSRFVMILGALDTASSFEGMGASREALYGMLTEPAFFVLAGTFALLTGADSFAGMFAARDAASLNALIPGLLAGFAFFLMLLVETGRLPVDDPRTHLELTMIHEVMILDYCGFDLALIHLSTWLRAAMYSALVALCVLPYDRDSPTYILPFAAVMAVVPITAGVFESFRARNRLQRNPSYILTVTVMAIVAFVTALTIVIR
jgi:formate hydrogenlyase subunit 4